MRLAGKESELESKTWGIIRAHAASLRQRRRPLESSGHHHEDDKKQNNRTLGTSDKRTSRISKLTRRVAKITVGWKRHLVKNLGKLKLLAISRRKILTCTGCLPGRT